MDSYYYYAACIFIMSVASISATLIETRAVSFDRAGTPKSQTDVNRQCCAFAKSPALNATFEFFEMDSVRYCSNYPLAC